MPLVHGQGYRIINTAAHTYVDLSGADNFTIQGWSDDDGADNQTWLASAAGDGWTFKNARKDRDVYLTVADYAGGSHTRVISGSTPVVWKLIPTGADRVYTVQLPLLKHPLNMDLSHSSPADGTPITVYTPNSQPNQAWKFVAKV